MKLVKRFGRFTRTGEPGLHYHLPYPIESLDKPRVTEVQRFEFGFRTVDPGRPPQYKTVPEEALMLTGDENIVDIDFEVIWNISDPALFLFKDGQVVSNKTGAAPKAMLKGWIDESI